jgi:predicted nuclease of restriction endonuclease-like (RecB) superfamily
MRKVLKGEDTVGDMDSMIGKLDLDQLAEVIRHVHKELFVQAHRAVNIGLTLRNWLIGRYIAEYELNGADRAIYGERILEELAARLSDVSNCNRRQLYRYLRFYRVYPDIVGTLSPQLRGLLPASASLEKEGAASPQSGGRRVPVIELLSYSHIEQLVDIEDEAKRLFYQVECIRGNWSFRTLKRQISSLYYERSGLSADKNKLSEYANQGAEQNSAGLSIRDPYIFEFLGIKPREVMSESQLEDELISKLEKFLLELGYGFCFEARQKRILIGDEHFFVDVVFYHRILKCHVLIELKLEPFTHENIGQLNTYVSWYKQNMMSEGDNPPVGILLCTAKNHALVEYALAGMDNSLFVSKYLLELPKKEEMQAFIEDQMRDRDAE